MVYLGCINTREHASYKAAGLRGPRVVYTSLPRGMSRFYSKRAVLKKIKAKNNLKIKIKLRIPMIFGKYDAIGLPSICFFFDVGNERHLLLSKYEKVHQQKCPSFLSVSSVQR